MPKINSLEVVHQDTNKDSYQNLHDILVALNKSLALEKEVVDGDARASIENLLEMYANDKEAFLRSVQTLTAEFQESKAQYSQEILLKASQLEALARKITSLTAKVQNNSAAIIHQETARVTADEAFAQELTLITADLNAANAAIIDEQTARVTADAALASDITTLSATVGTKNRTYYQSTAPVNNPPAIVLASGDLWIDSDDDKLYRYSGSSWVNVQDNEIAVNTAAISNEATARATADSANATAINAVTARLDTGDFATVKTQSSTTASKVAGIEARWGVTTNVNGYVAGIQLLNGGSTQSSFTVDATKFIVKKPDGTNGIAWNGAASRLDVSGDIYANNFYGTGVVGTTNVAGNAITNGSSVYGFASPVSVGLSTTGNKVYVWATCEAYDPGGGSVTVYLKRNGSVISSKAGGGWFSFIQEDYPSAGYNTYTITTDLEASMGTKAFYVNIMLLEIKR